MAGPTLEFLRCPSCGASTPLTGEDPATCIYCGRHIPVPERIGKPLQQFHEQIAKLKLASVKRRLDPEIVLVFGMALFLLLTMAFYLAWWAELFVDRWQDVGARTLIVLVELITVPIGLVALAFAIRDRNDFAKACRPFATLSFDMSAAQLVCPRCRAPLDCAEIHDLVVTCPACRTDLLVPSALLSEQLQAMFRRLMVLRHRTTDPYPIFKWVLIPLTAINGIVPIFLLTGLTAAGHERLSYLTGFTWSYMLDWVMTMWALREHGIRMAIFLFIAFIPLSLFFLFLMTQALSGADMTGLGG